MKHYGLFYKKPENTENRNIRLASKDKAEIVSESIEDTADKYYGVVKNED